MPIAPEPRPEPGHTWYRVTTRPGNAGIDPVRVLWHSAQQIAVPDPVHHHKLHRKSGPWVSYFPSWRQARLHLVRYHLRRIREATYELATAKQDLIRAKNWRP